MPGPLDLDGARAGLRADATVPTWALVPEAAEALGQAGVRDVVLVQRRRDGRVLVAVLPLEVLAPEVRQALEREPCSLELGTMGFSRFRRWLLAVDADGTAAIVRALGAAGTPGLA